MKLLFVRAPRYQWPFHSQHSSFWQPLGFCSMAAVLKENLDDIEIKIYDCPAMRMGWKSTKQMILREKPDILCIGEETVSIHEAFKLMDFTRTHLPDCTIIGGGITLTYLAKEILTTHPIDFIVKHEGELTLLELIKELRKDKNNQNFKKIKGIAYKEEKKIIETPLRQLLNMDDLPMPAYDLLDMSNYGKKSTNHRDFVAIEHSRGCSNSCNFCTLWKHMGSPTNGKILPCYRTKSVKKTIEEVILLKEKYKRKTFCWVDPTWNLLQKWNLDFANELISNGIEVDHSTWMRANCIIRDEKKGILKLQVKAGLKQAMIGVERTDEDDLAYFHKADNSFNTQRKAFSILRKYPSVLSVATYIYGIPDETKASMKRFYNTLGKIPFDVGLAIPLNPNPGTKYYDELKNKNLLEIEDFSYYNFVNPVARSKYMSRNSLLMHMILNEVRIMFKREYIDRHMINNRYSRRKTATRNVVRSKFRILSRFGLGIAQEMLFNKPYNYSVKPTWYDQ